MTERQRALLKKARDAILRTPDSYDQLTYGGGSISCETPGCVAGHIVNEDPKLRERLARSLAGTNDLEGHEKQAYTTWMIDEIATGALGAPTNPVLFQTKWPISWREATWKPNEERRRGHRVEKFVPTASDAVRVIDGILDGRIQGALGSR